MYHRRPRASGASDAAGSPGTGPGASVAVGERSGERTFPLTRAPPSLDGPLARKPILDQEDPSRPSSDLARRVALLAPRSRSPRMLVSALPSRSRAAARPVPPERARHPHERRPRLHRVHWAVSLANDAVSLGEAPIDPPGPHDHIGSSFGISCAGSSSDDGSGPRLDDSARAARITNGTVTGTRQQRHLPA